MNIVYLFSFVELFFSIHKHSDYISGANKTQVYVNYLRFKIFKL